LSDSAKRAQIDVFGILNKEKTVTADVEMKHEEKDRPSFGTVWRPFSKKKGAHGGEFFALKNFFIDTANAR
jgi:hypothetical protein